MSLSSALLFCRLGVAENRAGLSMHSDLCCCESIVLSHVELGVQIGRHQYYTGTVMNQVHSSSSGSASPLENGFNRVSSAISYAGLAGNRKINFPPNSYHGWQRHRTGCSRSPIRTLTLPSVAFALVAPLWCDLGCGVPEQS